MELRHKPELNESRTIRGSYDLEFYRSYRYEEARTFKINQYPSERKPDYFRWIYKDEPFLNPIYYNFTSRYENVPIKKEQGKSYHVTNRFRGVVYSDADVIYEVTNETENRLDKISLQFYNNPIYWWVIAHANGIFDSLSQVTRGIKLRIPPLNSINGYYVK